MSERRDFVAALIAGGMSNAGELSRGVRRKFGKGLNLMDARKLQAAFSKGGFNRVWDELFGDEDDVLESMAEITRAKKSRGEHRRKLAIKGRRGIDRHKIVLREFSPHLVVYRNTEGMVHSQTFDSRKRAEALVKELAALGLEVTYYRRTEVAIAIAA